MQKYTLMLHMICLIICSVSCQNLHKSSYLIKDYVIPDSVFYDFDTITHFSLIEMGGDIIDRQYPYFTDEFELLYRWKVYQCKDSSQLKRFQNQCIQSAVYVVTLPDSLFFTFDNERSLKSEYDTVILESLFENIPNCGHLIPDFNYIIDLLSNGTKQFSLDSMVFYVIKFGDCFILPKDYEYNWSLLPNKIRHGYNSGIAFDKKTPDVIYSWSIAW
ncbi:MAG: hypothetical protein MJZ87_01000 [Bacteroidales bacterium]|nr:hypothetical protein [Bacteroidales bacterium]